MAEQYRLGKSAEYEVSDAGKGAYRFDALFAIQTLWSTDVSSSAGGTAILGTLVIPQTCVVVKLGVFATAVTSTVAADNLLQVQVGPAASTTLTFTATSATVGAGQTAQAIGHFLFATAPALYATAGGNANPVVSTFFPDQPEAYYLQGQCLHFQIKSTSGGGVSNPIVFSALCATYDPLPFNPQAIGTTTYAGVNPAVDF